MTSRRLLTVFALLAVFAMVLSACGPAATPVPQAAPPTEAPKPTEAPAPTEAPKPTEAPAPTEAPKPTEAPAAPAAASQTKTATDTLYEAVSCDYGGEFKSMEAVDDYTVKFTLCAPDVAFPSKAAFSAFAIHSAAQLKATAGTSALLDVPIGTGPYMLDKWNKGDSIVMKPNPELLGREAEVRPVGLPLEQGRRPTLVGAAGRDCGRHRQPVP